MRHYGTVYLAILQLSQVTIRNASTLVLVEHNGDKVAAITYNAISAATQIGGSVSALVVGPDCSKVGNALLLFAFDYIGGRVGIGSACYS